MANVWSDSPGTMGMIWREREAGTASVSSQRASMNGGGSFAGKGNSRMRYSSQSTMSASESAEAAGAAGAAAEEHSANTEEAAGAAGAADEDASAATEEAAGATGPEEEAGAAEEAAG